MPESNNQDTINGKKPRVSKAEPIKSLTDVRRIIDNLKKGHPRNRLLFIVGVNCPLRIGTLLELKVGNVRNLEEGDRFYFDHSDSEKPRNLEINRKVFNALRKYLRNEKIQDDDYLFCGNKPRKPLSKQHANRLIKEWVKGIGLSGNYGNESLRKTFGYIQRTVYGVGFDVLCDKFNHKTPAQTARLLGVDENTHVSIILNKVG